MDNMEKDKFIKEKFKQDKQMSDKANLMFERMMNTNFDDIEEKIIDTKEDMKQAKIIPFRKRFASIAASVIILFIGMNVYAYSQGWDNIFFKIKEIFTGVEEIDKDKLLSDRDLVISYSNIEVAEGLNIAINKITTEDNKTTLHVKLKTEKTAKESKLLPITFEVLDSQGVTVAKQQSQIKGDAVESEETIIINKKVDVEIDILTLNIYSKENKLLKTINIDLLNKTLIQVLGENDIKKLSEIDLKQKLGAFATLVFNEKEIIKNESTKQVMLAIMIHNADSDEDENVSFNEKTGMYEYKKETIDKFGEAIFGIKYLYGKDLNKDILKLNNETKAYYFAEAGDMLFGGYCLSISDLSMSEGVYKVRYVATTAVEEMTEDLYNSLDKYVIETKFVLNDNDMQQYCKYQIVDIGIVEVIPGGEEIDNKLELEDEEKTEDVVDDNENTIENNGISLKFNKEWEYSYTKTSKKIIIKSPVIEDEKDIVKITFEKEENENLGNTIYEIGQEMVSDAEKDENFDIVHRGEVEISDYNAYQVTVSSNDGTNIRKRIFKTLVDEYMYTITVEASEYKYGDYFPDVMKIINSMKIEENI